MRVTHELAAVTVCPVTDRPDVYRMTVETDRLISVEEIIEAVDRYSGEAIYQEDLTQQLATELVATVETVGTHSGVTTTVVAEP